jgi:hypothetical protein
MLARGYRDAGFTATLTIGCNSLIRVAKVLPDPAPAQGTCRNPLNVTG